MGGGSASTAADVASNILVLDLMNTMPTTLPYHNIIIFTLFMRTGSVSKLCFWFFFSY